MGEEYRAALLNTVVRYAGYSGPAATEEHSLSLVNLYFFPSVVMALCVRSLHAALLAKLRL